MTWDSNIVYSYPARDDGGFIPDPRIKGLQTIENSIKKIYQLDYVKEALAEYTKTSTKWIADHGTVDQFKNEIKNWTDDDFKINFPPRSKGDMVLRRTRFSDCLSTWGDAAIEILYQLAGLDYIRALITVWYVLGCGRLFEHRMLPLLKLPIDVFDKSMGELTNILKSSNHEEGWEMYAELKCLTGYRLLPWPDYDPIEDTKALASGGIEKHMPGGFNEWAEKTLRIRLATTETFMSFSEFIESGTWITQGASSQGRLFVTLEGKKYKVKCRKNMLVDVYTTDQLVQYALETERMTSTAFTKNELGKVRVAVCSDLATYLKMAYIVFISGKGYLKWSHVTRNENSYTKVTRMRDMLRLLRRGLFGLPWDFKGFERQVKTEELVSVYDQIVHAAEMNVPLEQQQSFKDLCSQVRKSFFDSVIIDMDGNELKVTGGLPSGLFLTSITGDGYNKVLFECATSLMEQLGMPQRSIGHTDIQGDDTSLLHRRVGYLQIYDWVVTQIGAEAGTGKFGILAKQTEFLRVSFGPWGARGYPARSVAGIVQRKPWSDSPFKEADTISGAVEAVNTCLRRGLGYKNVAQKLIAHWSRVMKISSSIVSTPVVCGGLGIGPPLINTRVKHLPKVELPDLEIDMKTTTRKTNWHKRAIELNFPVTEAKLDELAHEDSRQTIIGDEVKGVSKEARKKWKQDLQRAKIVIVKLDNLVVLAPTLEEEAKKIFNLDYSFTTGNFGKWRHLELEMTDLKRLGWEATPQNIKDRYTDFYYDRLKLKHMSIKDAELWLFGGLSAHMAEMNNTLTKRFTECIATQIRINDIPKGRLADVWYKISYYLNFYVRRLPEYSEILLW